MTNETRDFAEIQMYRCIRCGVMFGLLPEAQAHVKEHEAAEARQFPAGHTHATDSDADTCPTCFPPSAP